MTKPDTLACWSCDADITDASLLIEAKFVVLCYSAAEPSTVAEGLRTLVPSIEMLRRSLREHAKEFATGVPCEHEAADYTCGKCAPAILKKWEEDNPE